MPETPHFRDAPLHWGESREMNATEALMWRMEVDPRLRSTICGLEILDCVPEWDRFLAACDWGTRMAPRFRQKVVEPALGIGNPRWVNDPDFDLHYHVRRVALPEDGGWPELLSSCEQIAMTPFDRARSPWESVLFEGLPGGRAAHLLKMHHSTTDGLGSVQLLSQLHSRRRESNPEKPQPPPPPPERASPIELLLEQLAHDAQAVPGLVREAIDGLLSLTNPVESARNALRFGASLGRLLADPGAPGSPLLTRRSLSWRFLALDVSFPDFRAASKVADASLNDAFVAALLGAFRLYHEKLGRPISRMPMAIPISVRREDDPEGGNHFAGARFAGPVGIADPVERMRTIGRLVRSVRDEPALDGMSALAPALTRLPAPLLAAVAGSLTQANDLQASNVPGLREDVFFAGAKVERSYGFGPLPGCAAMITLVSHGNQCCVAANVDPAAVTRVELFGECLMRGFSEVLALHPGSAAPVAHF
ncbi:MAG: wax ester/triacylglycerol synthase family O-acyltransferase [Myxococcota bacterium]|nr:wax ester/triacylglycerol synthase family O-acyltransferase [Myxococcota bacterium]